MIETQVAHRRPVISLGMLKQPLADRSLLRSKLFTVLFLTSLMVFNLAIALLILSKQSLRLDEAQSLWQSSFSYSGILKVIAQDVHLPLYHLLLHTVQVFWGNGVETARYLSLFFFLLSIPAMYYLGLLLGGKKVAGFSTLLFSFSAFMNWYANEIRMYTLLTLLTITVNILYIKLIKAPSKSIWTGYLAIILLGIYTHYFFWLVLLTHFIFFLFNQKLFNRKSFQKFLLIGGFAVVCILPWLFLVVSSGSAEGMQPLLTNPTSVDLFNTYSRFLFGFQDNNANTIILSLWPFLIFFLFLLLRRNQRVQWETVFLTLSATLPVFIVFFISVFIRPVFLARYLIIVLPVLYILIAKVVMNTTGFISWITRSVIVLLFLGLLVQQSYSSSNPVREDYQEVVEYIEENAAINDVVLISAPFTIFPFDYYYRGSAVTQTVPEWDRVGGIPAFDADRLRKQVDTLKTSYTSTWIVLSYDQGFESEIKSYFDNNFERLSDKEFSPGLNVYQYKLRYD
jgi:uncharacterized membrane protein